MSILEFNYRTDKSKTTFKKAKYKNTSELVKKYH
jgi:hypothetical protein